MKQKITPSELHEKLKNIFKDEIGSIYFNMAGICFKIRSKDTIGLTLQSWLKEYLLVNDYYFKEPDNTQEFPDFFLDKSLQKDLLEMKSFNYEKSPGFDIANFDSYCNNIMQKPYYLYSDYLIFGYEMHDGEIEIKDIWLKKIWQIAGRSQNTPLKVQKKYDKIYNIRPSSKFKYYEEEDFKNEIEFLKAIYETIKLDKSLEKAENWKKTFNENYEKYYKKIILK